MFSHVLLGSFSLYSEEDQDMLVQGINIMLYVVPRLLARSQIPNHLLLQNNKEQDNAKREIY